MKKTAFNSKWFFLPIILFLIAILLCWSCVSAAPPKSAGFEEKAAALAAAWTNAIKSLNIKQYTDQYWDNAVQLRIAPNGIVRLVEGKQAIANQQNTIFADYGEALASYVFPKPEFLVDDSTHTPQIVFWYENAHLFAEVLRLEDRSGTVKIAEQWIFSRLFDPFPKVGGLNAWADENGNGVLDPGEQLVLFGAGTKVMFNPGRTENPLDVFFDWNGNGRIDDVESELARFEFLRNRIRRIELLDRDFVRQRTRTGIEARTELNVLDANWLQYVVQEGMPSKFLQDGSWKAADFNNDGHVSPTELEAYKDLVSRMAAVNGTPILYTGSMYCFIDDIRRWADVDGDFTLSEVELSDVSYELLTLTQYQDFAGSPLLRFFDRNRDLKINAEERAWAIDFIVYFLLPNALEQQISIWNWYLNKEVVFTYDPDKREGLSQAEIDDMRSLIKTYDNQVWTKNDPDGLTQRWVDMDGNGVIETNEAACYLDMLFKILVTVWFRLPQEDANSIEVQSLLDKNADMNNDGILSMGERKVLIDALTREHKALSGIDKTMDVNSDGVVSMEEIARAKENGNTSVNAVLTQRITHPSALSSTQPSISGDRSGQDKQSVIKPIALRGSTLAVLGVQDMTGTLKLEQTDLLISFIENAFVNFGSTTVVDRQNLSKIMEEYKFQSSAFSDDKSAVEIGKLSGADVIAVAKLSSLAGSYYLHLKVINVKSGTIIGSSISEGTSEKQFLDMCNGAVRPLF